MSRELSVVEIILKNSSFNDAAINLPSIVAMKVQLSLTEGSTSEVTTMAQHRYDNLYRSMTYVLIKC